MEIFSMTEISIPVTQMVLLLLLSTGALFFGKLTLALLVNCLFTPDQKGYRPLGQAAAELYFFYCGRERK